jgi:hypothetical protein
MILLDHISFEQWVEFLQNSIHQYPDNSAFEEALRRYPGDIASGLRAYHTLMRQIYSDTTCIDGKDDPSKYLDLIATMWFLYVIFAYGTLVCEQDECRVLIDKALLKQHYKKGGFNKRHNHLAHHGFSLTYLAEQEVSKSLSKASHLSLAYAEDPNLIPAVKVFAENIVAFEGNAPGKKAETVQYNKLSMFLKGDYETAFLHTPVPRDALNPLRQDLVGTIAAYRQEWEGLVGKLLHQCGLQCSGFWGYGGMHGPAWGVSFAAKGKRPLAIFTLGLDIVFIEFTLPLDAAERIIRARGAYSDTIHKKIEGLHCVQCPKQCKGSNLTKVDGVWLCSGRAEARRIYTTLTTPEDFASVHAMIDAIC